MATKNKQTFESALQELHTIVSTLEEGSLGLEDAMKQFEKGTKLLRECHTKLESAEASIQQLTGFDADGNPVTTPFDATDTLSQKEAGAKAGKRKTKSKKAPSSKKASPPPEEDDSGTLF